MPLSKYLIRNEYSLADPELYRAADKDDPEALLEAVAMAGLVGLLRQLGDLAEFAAEIFHDLHEEVMATAARGHSLTARVKQLEAEVPSLEKAFFSQTHHSSFFTNGGIDWHPNLRSEQNLVTGGNLPRLIMDSYEECRGPPRLFLLDKFDVAGAGACLKRYTDPSFFKVESASSVRATVQVHRERRIRKVKQKKGARLRDGEAPNTVPAHSKLHQLLLEERIENGYSNPARLVKLKKRQLNGPAVEEKSGKSYMEKFLETPSPDPKMIYETSIFPLPVKPAPDDSNEAGIKVLEISSIKKSTGDENSYSSPYEQEFELNQFPEEVGETNGDLVMVKEQISAGVRDEMSFNDVKVSDEKELAINGQKKIEGSLDRYNSDDVTSEVDNYMDALTTMESELETDDEYKPKKSFLSIKKETDTNNKEHQLQARFSDSQSFGGSSTSDDISSFKQETNEEDIEVKARLSDSHSTGTSPTSDNNCSFRGDEDEHVELQAHFSDSQSTGKSSMSDVNSSSVKEIEGMPSNQLPEIVEFQNKDNRKFVTRDDAHFHEEGVSNPWQSNSEMLTSGKMLCSDLEPTKPATLPVVTQSDDSVSDNIELNIRLGNGADRAGLVESVASKPSSPSLVESVSSKPSSPSLIEDDTCPMYSSDKISLDNLVDDSLCNDSQEGSLCPLCPSIKELDLNSGLNVVPDRLDSKDEDCINITRQLDPTVVEVPPVSFLTGQLSSGITHNKPQDGLGSTEVEVLFCDLQSNYGNIPNMVHGDEINGFSSSVDPVQGDGHIENPSSYNHVMVTGVITEIIESNDQPVPFVDSAENDVGIITCPASSMICSPSRIHSNPQELVHASSDSYPVESNDVELTQISMDSNTEMSQSHLAPLSDTTSNIIYSPMSSLSKLESVSAFADPNEKETEVHEAVARESLTALEGQEVAGHPELVSSDVQMNLDKLVPCELPDLENNIEKSPRRKKILQSVFQDDAKMVPGFSGFDTQQSESTSYGQSDLKQNDRNSFSSTPYNKLESETYLEPHLQCQLDEHDGEFPLKYEENCVSEKSQSQQMHIDQLKQEGTHATSESVSEIPADESPSFYSSQSSDLEINPTQYVTDPLKPLPPGHFPKEAENKLDEMPPMPPLPPMQWRMGKVPHASLDSQREGLEVHPASVQPMQPIMPDTKSQFGFPASYGDTLFHQNPFLPIMALDSDKLQHSSAVGVSGHPVALPFQFPIVVNEANGQYNYLVLDRNQIQKPLLTLPIVPTSMHPPLGYVVASDGEMVQTSNPYVPILPAAYTASEHDSTSPQVEPLQHPTQVMTETSADDETLEQPVHNVVCRDGPPNSHVIGSDGEIVHNSNSFLPIPPVECANSGHDSIFPIENVSESPTQLMTETSSDDTTLPQPMSNVISMDNIVIYEEEMVENSPGHPVLSAESAVSEHDSISPQEKLTQPPSQLLRKTSLEVKTPNHSVSNVEGEHGQLGISLVLPPNMESVELNQSFQPFEGEMSSLGPSAQTSDFESERTNVKPKHKIPRPRNPLIDAVAAHDKSKLRRATERVMPQIAPKVDERDSWLEQIRTKSFNLKPAVAKRPSIQGPKTNMKLAAILEKANSIRQALAGSDEDDDEDSWSDS